MVIEINGVKCMHISDFAYQIHRTVPTVRHLILKGNSIRHLKAIRNIRAIYVAEPELEGYPFLDPGLFNGFIYHYVKSPEGYYTRELCKTCSFTTEKCEARKKADEVNITEVPSVV